MMKICKGCQTPKPLTAFHKHPNGRHPRCKTCRSAQAGHTKRQPLEIRFWSKVLKTDGCWLWQASCYKAGYGRTNVGTKEWLAHRLAYTLTYGEIPDGFLVCHQCDNPGCVRPDHLFLGSYTDNNRDKARKGRHRNQHS